VECARHQRQNSIVRQQFVGQTNGNSGTHARSGLLFYSNKLQHQPGEHAVRQALEKRNFLEMSPRSGDIFFGCNLLAGL
jgi:hypothetical protein